MLISKKWLQSYFVTELPSARKIADMLMLHSFEIEDLREVADDWVIDIDVLPNRAHDCLAHKGVALEISGLLGMEIIKARYTAIESFSKTNLSMSINLQNKEQCPRYIGSVVENIQIQESPQWLKNRLSSMGQKSINNLVDATNYIMFDLGQPMHVFDADKVVGAITIRNAEYGEQMTTLSGEELELQESDLLICDDKNILALAGVKGGNFAEVDGNTKNIIIESANFNPLTTRKTARRVRILTDSSKRYENAISSEKAEFAMSALHSLIAELAWTDATKIGQPLDVYPNPESQFELEFTLEHTQRLLGLAITESEINIIFDKFNYLYSVDAGIYRIKRPFDRLDLNIPEDMIEEIGRLYGYHNIPVKSLDEYHFEPKVNPTFFAAQKLRNYFIENSFTEIMNYTFVNKGDVELFNPLASDKKALRKNLSTQMAESIEKNGKLANFVNTDQVLNFEIDVVHVEGTENTMCCFGIDTLSKKSKRQYGTTDAQIENHLLTITKLFGLETLDYSREGGVVSFNIDQCQVETGNSYNDLLKPVSYGPDARFMGISVYPYTTRDISFWVAGSDKTAEDYQDIINRSGARFVKKVFLFDEFEKEGRVSYAFSVVFQSQDRTLTDLEVDVDMKKITLVLQELGCEVR